MDLGPQRGEDLEMEEMTCQNEAEALAAIHALRIASSRKFVSSTGAMCVLEAQGYRGVAAPEFPPPHRDSICRISRTPMVSEIRVPRGGDQSSARNSQTQPRYGLYTRRSRSTR